MKKIVRIKESQLNTIIGKVIKEQEDQYMTDKNPEQMAGGANDEPGEESGEPDFSAFVEAGKALLGQGVTIGDLVNKLVDEGNEEEPNQSDDETNSLPNNEYEAQPGASQTSTPPLAESRRKK